MRSQYDINCHQILCSAGEVTFISHGPVGQNRDQADRPADFVTKEAGYAATGLLKVIQDTAQGDLAHLEIQDLVTILSSLAQWESPAVQAWQH